MLNNKSKNKGFTIVELVIVIAVIAVLAAVLIPTFSGIIDKANTSNDISVARNANTLLSTEFNLATKDDYINFLSSNNVTLNPYNTNNIFVIDISKKLILILDRESGECLYPEDYDGTLEYSIYKYADNTKTIIVDVTPDTFVKNRAYYTEGRTTAGSTNGSTFFESAILDISQYKECEIKFLLPVYRTLSNGQCPYGNFTSMDNTSFKIEKSWDVILPDDNTRTYQEISFTVGENDHYLYLNRFMSGTENVSYSGDYYVKVVDTEYEEYCFKTYDMTDNYILLDSSEMCDYFSIGSDGKAKADTNFSASSYIECKNAVSLSISMVKTASVKYLAFYNQNKELISTVASNTSASEGTETVTIEVPSNAYYFKTSYYNFDKSKLYGDFSCKIYYPENYTVSEKRENIGEAIYFSQRVNQNLDYYEAVDYVESDSDYKQTTGVLLLPDSYSATGEKTKLIIYCHGYSHYVYYGKWGATDTFYQQKEYFASRGYAVLGCNGARDNNKLGKFTSAGSPQFVNAYHECLEYVLEHYNIDPEVYVIGGSAGGPLAINYAYTYQDSVRALQLISTWTNIETCEWGQGVKNSFVEYLEFNNTITYEYDKALKYNPTNHIADGKITDLTIPINIHYGETEKSNFFIEALRTTYYNALVNGGREVTIKEIQGYGHDIVSGNVNISDSAICDFFDGIN